VSLLKRRLRSLLVALAVLALSAGAVMAGRGSHPASLPQTSGTEASDQGDQNEQGDQDEGNEADAPETEAPDADQSESGDTGAPESDAGSGVHPDNHGKLVSEAAQAETPAGFDNHGAYVRTVAHQNHGADASAKGKATSAAAKSKHQTH
jgi:hypothetical protein